MARSSRVAVGMVTALTVGILAASGAGGVEPARGPSADAPPSSTGEETDPDPTASATGYLDGIADGEQAIVWTLCFPAVGATLRKGRVDWGDDSTVDVGDGMPDLAHTYVFGGAYTITLTCADSAGTTFTDDVVLLVEGPAAPAPRSDIDAGPTVLLARRTKVNGCQAGPRPDLRCSPGAYSAKLTKTVLCSPTFQTRELKGLAVSLRRAVAAAYGLKGRTVVVGAVIPPSLGGALHIANLFAQRALSRSAALARGRLESDLRRKVCAGAVGLRAAQRQLVRDWSGV